MPALKLKAIETSDKTLDTIEEKLGLGTYDVIEELEKVAYARLHELREEALANA
jgi:hypothetical protein